MSDFDVYIDGGVRVTDHCHIARKYTGCPQRDCNIKI